MFDQDIKLNRFLLNYFDQIVADIPADRIAEPAQGGGHPPLWVLGHLAIVGEMGQAMLGGRMMHPEWVEMFGPGSSDQVSEPTRFSKKEFVDCIRSGYPKLCAMLAAAPKEALDVPHGVELLSGTHIETAADLQSHLLTSHFSFHLAQLSAWRRGAGKGPII